MVLISKYICFYTFILNSFENVTSQYLFHLEEEKNESRELLAKSSLFQAILLMGAWDVRSLKSKTPVEIPASRSGVPGLKSFSTSCFCTTRFKAGNGSSIQVPTSHVRGLCGVPDF